MSSPRRTNWSLLTGPTALTRSETARLNAVNLGSARLTVTAKLIGPTGPLAQKRLVLAPGAMGSLDVRGTANGLDYDSRGRLQVRGELASPVGTVAGSLEVFDTAGGSTHVLLTASLPGPLPEPGDLPGPGVNPIPMPTPLLTAGPVGLSRGEAAQLAVTNIGTTRAVAIATIAQAESVVERRLTLAAGQTRTIEVDPVSRALPFDTTRRTEVRGQVRCASRLCYLVATLQAFAVTNGSNSGAAPAVTPIQLPGTR